MLRFPRPTFRGPVSRAPFGLLLLWLLCPFLLKAQQTLRVHPENPWIFEFRGQPTVLRTFAEHYGAVIHPGFNQSAYLDSLEASGLNLTRVVLAGFHANSGDVEDTLSPPLNAWLQPWPRTTASGTAMDGFGKWNLAAWNATYFNRLRAFIQAASDRGIVVELTFFNTYYEEHQWELSPFKPTNNVQGIGPTNRYDSMRPVDSNLLYRQTEVVRKIVREVNEFDNVYFEIQNEPFWNERYAGNYQEAAFHNTMLAAIRDEESTLPRQHLVAHNYPQILDGLTDDYDIINTHYPFAVPSTPIIGGENLLQNFTSQGRVLGLDETSMAGPVETRLEAWMFLLGGGAVYNGLDQGSAAYSISDPAGGNPPAPAVRAVVRSLGTYVDSLDLTGLRRDLSWIAGGAHPSARKQAMAKPGQQYVAYFYHGSFSQPYQTVYSPIDASNHSTTLQVSLPAGSYRAVWTRPSNMSVLHSETFTHGGGTRSLQNIVYQEDVALRIDRTGAGDTTPPPPPSSPAATIDTNDFIALGWFAPNAADLAGYRIYRSSGAGEPDFSGPPIATPAAGDTAFTDTTAAPGQEHRYVITALDDQGNESRFSTVALAVAPNNLDPPVAEAGNAQSFVDTDLDLGETVTFDGSASAAGDRPILQWSWRLGGVEIANGETASAFVPAGIHDVELIVTDEAGLTATDTVRIVISNPAYINGSFEDSTTGPYPAGVFSVVTTPPAGWVWNLDSNPANGLAGHDATDGSTVLIFNGGGKPAGSSVTQTFPTVPGTTYQVDLDMGVTAFNSNIQRLSVLVRGDGVLANPVFSQAGTNSGSTVVWSNRSFTFTADSAVASITLTDTSPAVNGVDLVIDNVRVRAQADRTLTILSDPADPVTMVPIPADLNSEGAGATPLVRNYADAAAVSVSAPPVSGSTGFHHWLVDGVEAGSANPILVTLYDDVTLTAVYEDGPPVILAHPEDLHVVDGAAASFSVSAVSSGALTYQWRRNGGDIEGAESETYQIPQVGGMEAGAYEVAVTSDAGTTVSEAATLSVAVPGFANGGFESALDGWAFTGNVFPLGPFPGYEATEGTELVVFNGGNTPPDGVLEQTIATTPGTTYRLRFDAGVISYKLYQQSLGVEVTGDSTLLSQSIPFTGSTSGVGVWQSFSFTFTADSGATTIRFRDLSPTTISIDLLLDNISLGAISPVQFSVSQPPQPSLVVTPLETGCRVTLTAYGAGRHKVEWSDDLGIWETLDEQEMGGPGEVEIIDPETPPDGRRFYRASASP
ncbi:MAG: DUF642 domain-containing protein [Akkermansiaceae bacterium]|nr:DUF642 domain-containing protein [Akkermansiaceae bacterium]